MEQDGPITLRILDGIAWVLYPSEMMDVMEDREVWRLSFANLIASTPSNFAEKRATKKIQNKKNLLHLHWLFKGVRKTLI